MPIKLPGIALQPRYNWPFTCPFCKRGVAAREVNFADLSSHQIVFADCPICEGTSTWISTPERHNSSGIFLGGDISREERMAGWKQVFPESHPNARDFPHCPPEIYRDYQDAQLILEMSPRASAAFARRALQVILHKIGIKGSSLAAEIQSVLDSKDKEIGLPGYLAKTVDLIRAYGNFGAHPISAQENDRLVNVEPEEARTCILIVEDLIDFYFERPALASERRETANQKLSSAGKPPLKG